MPILCDSFDDRSEQILEQKRKNVLAMHELADRGSEFVHMYGRRIANFATPNLAIPSRFFESLTKFIF